MNTAVFMPGAEQGADQRALFGLDPQRLSRKDRASGREVVQPEKLGQVHVVPARDQVGRIPLAHRVRPGIQGRHRYRCLPNP